MVRNEVRRTLADPGQIANAELTRLPKRGGEHQPRRIGKCTSPTGGPLRSLEIKPARSQGLCQRQVETKQIAAIDRHGIILMVVEML